MSTSSERFGDEFGGEQMWGLQELPLPESVSYIPQTVGWLYVAVILLAIFVFWCYRMRRRWLHNAYRRNGIAQLKEIMQQPDNLSLLPFILRKAALSAFPRQSVASLRGQNWIDWLNKSVDNILFVPEDARLLDELPYANNSDKEIDAPTRQRLITNSISWLRDHRAGI